VSVKTDFQLGPFRGSEAIDDGRLTRQDLRGSAWRRLLPDIYVAADVPVNHRLWCRAASVWVGELGAVSGLSAAHMWGADVLPSDEIPAEVTVPSGIHRRSTPQVRVVRSALEPGDVAVTASVRVCTPERTAFDLARRLPLVDAVVAIDAMLAKRLLTKDRFMEYWSKRHGWPGEHALPVVAERLEPLSGSPMESRLRVVLLDGGLPQPVAQYRAYEGRRFLGRIDLAYPVEKIGIEYESGRRRDRDSFRAELLRANELRRAGWTVLGFTATDVYREPERIVAAVRATLPDRPGPGPSEWMVADHPTARTQTVGTVVAPRGGARGATVTGG
jgi:hypothetical protein